MRVCLHIVQGMHFTPMVKDMGMNKVVNVIRHLAFEDMGSFSSVLEAPSMLIRYVEKVCREHSTQMIQLCHLVDHIPKSVAG